MLVKRMSMVTPQVRGTTSSLPCHATHSNRNKTSGTRRRNGGGVLGWKRRQGHHDRYTNAFLMRAKEGEDQDELYDYGTEKVRNLLKRDSKELRVSEQRIHQNRLWLCMCACFCARCLFSITNLLFTNLLLVVTA